MSSFNVLALEQVVALERELKTALQFSFSSSCLGQIHGIICAESHTWHSETNAHMPT
jgi:hypothetical protein